MIAGNRGTGVSRRLPRDEQPRIPLEMPGRFHRVTSLI